MKQLKSIFLLALLALASAAFQPMPSGAQEGMLSSQQPNESNDTEIDDETKSLSPLRKEWKDLCTVRNEALRKMLKPQNPTRLG